MTSEQSLQPVPLMRVRNVAHESYGGFFQPCGLLHYSISIQVFSKVL